MKLAYKTLDNITYLPKIKQKPPVLQTIFQLFLTLGALHIANKITVDIWRSLTGH